MSVVMQLGMVLFFILFTFLLAIFVVVVLAIFKKEKRGIDFEPCVSIVVPAYNEENNIADCLVSIRKLDYPKKKMELIVVDDGSTDYTSEIAQKLGAKVVRGKHKGKAIALNVGVRAARHE